MCTLGKLVSACRMQAVRRQWRRTCVRACSGAGRRPRGAPEKETPLRRLLDSASAFGEGEAAEPELQWATQPYAARVARSAPPPARDQIDPRETTVLLFPGQGSQRVGMGLGLKDVPAARELYDLASSVVGWDVWRVCTAGPAEELERRCQTCVLVTSLGALERAREERPAAVERARAAAGFSLGEVAALVFAGALPLEGALRLVEVRAAAMRAAAAARPAGMLTVWLAPDAPVGRTLAQARDHARARGVADPVCQVANYLYPGCKVIAGDEEALAWVERNAAAAGVRRCARVRVAGGYHTPLMARAEEAVRAAVAALRVAAPRLAVVSGERARAYRSAGEVAAGLPRALTRPVRWEQTLHALYARPQGHRFPLTLALGPGGTLRATLKQVNARAWDASLQLDV